MQSDHSAYAGVTQSPYPQQAAQAPHQPAPAGFTDAGKPVLFYVTAIYDYVAAGPDEFSFASGDVISVTATDPDGWWQGTPVGVASQGHIFPSNFTELLP